MGQGELTRFIILANVIILIFISGLVVFILQYRKRKMMHEKEKDDLAERHRVDMMQSRLDVQQQTMQFIGQEIHDSVTQKLTLASIYSQHLEFDPQDPGNDQRLAAVGRIINSSLLELRELSRNLTDPRMQEASLSELIRMESDQLKATGVCRIEVDLDESANPETPVKSNLIRVIQEFFQNSLKHAACGLIKVQLLTLNNGIQLILEDNGKGFDPAVRKAAGVGLENMKRRVQFAGGDFQLFSGAGNGTKVTIFIPDMNVTSNEIG